MEKLLEIFNKDTRYIKGIGPHKASLLKKKLGICTLRDILDYFPSQYRDLSSCKRIVEVKEDEEVCLKAKIITYRKRFFRKGVYIFEALLQDDTGALRCVWFSKSYFERSIHLNKEAIFFGKVKRRRGVLQIENPEFEFIEDISIDSNILPVYSLKQTLSQKFFRKVMWGLLNTSLSNISDFIPFPVREKANIKNIVFSYRNIHFPQSWEALKEAKSRFIFEDFFILQVLVFLRKAQWRRHKIAPIESNFEELVGYAEGYFGFRLTSSQKKVLRQILEDFSKGYPSKRLLQGDVGSGKTVVAACASLVVARKGWQVAFMVPTEILAWQHYNRLKNFFEGKNVRVELFSSSTLQKNKNVLYKDLEEGKITVAIGTHALLQEKLKFKKLGLIIIDEQHRFGVEQRVSLIKKARCPHLLIMTATPIPRTLSMVCYADMDISKIEELPAGRKIPQTLIFKERERDKVYRLIREKLREGRQIYFVFPLIGEYVQLNVKGAQLSFYQIKDAFPEYNVELLHGDMNFKEQRKIMSLFSEGKIHILVCTQIIEVGVDVPNASCMVIEEPQRFGLSQLHQLRGRIMRSCYKPLCILITPEELPPQTKRRLEIFSSTTDGFKIAEEDLRLRGPGEFMGLHQHGQFQLRIADPLRDWELLKKARILAYRLVREDPLFKNRSNKLLRQIIESKIPQCMWFQVD